MGERTGAPHIRSCSLGQRTGAPHIRSCSLGHMSGAPHKANVALRENDAHENRCCTWSTVAAHRDGWCTLVKILQIISYAVQCTQGSESSPDDMGCT